MNVRLPDRPVETTRQPLRVVVDGRMKTPPSAKIRHTPGGAVWIVAAKDDEGKRGAQAVGAKVVVLPDPNNPEHVDLAALSPHVGRGGSERSPRRSGGRFERRAPRRRGSSTNSSSIGAVRSSGGPPRRPAVAPQIPGAAPRRKTVSADVLAGGDIRIICRRN